MSDRLPGWHCLPAHPTPLLPASNPEAPLRTLTLNPELLASDSLAIGLKGRWNVLASLGEVYLATPGQGPPPRELEDPPLAERGDKAEGRRASGGP